MLKEKEEQMKKKLLTITSLLLVVSLLSGCFGGNSGDPTGDSVEPSTSVVGTTSEEPTSPVPSEEPSVELVPEISITNAETTIWMDETLTLTTELVNGEGETVAYTTSDELKATVDEAGLITPKGVGEVTIGAHLVSDPLIKAEKSFTIKDTVLDTAFGFGNFDYTNLKADEPSVVTTKANAEWPYAEAVYKNVSGRRYYAEASFEITGINTGWVWNRLSIGHRNAVLPEAEYIFRGLNLSYGDGSNKKTVIMETPNNWGETTDRSQVWGLNGISDIQFGVGETVKLSTLRDANDYYYYINGRLMWFETYDNRFLDADTAPAIVLHDYHARVFGMFATADANLIDAELAKAESKRVLFPTKAENVVIDAELKTIDFVNATAGWPFSNIKDTAAKSVGDAFSFPRDVNAVASFDFKVNSMVDPDTSILAFTLNHWGKDASNRGPNRAITISFGNNGAGITEWDSNGDLPVTAGIPLVYPSPLQATNSVTIERVITGADTSFVIKLNGEVIANTFVAAGYTDAYTLWFGARTMNATISNYAVA